MRVLSLLPLAAIASAIVTPDDQILNSLSLEKQHDQDRTFVDPFSISDETWADVDESVHKVIGCLKHKLDDTLDSSLEVAVQVGQKLENAFAGQSWLDTADFETNLFDGPGSGPPHQRPDATFPYQGHHDLHHPHKPNMTVYQLIANSNYTTKLAKLINEYEDLVELLNGTTANFTVFAPTDKAFEKIPKHGPEPSKEFLKELLTYHVSPEFFPAGGVLVTRTIPTALEAKYIGDEPQRLSTQISLKGLTVNFYARIVAIDIFGTNGVIHGIDSILLPPPNVIDIISSLPGEFSTLELALLKTGLIEALNDTSAHVGGTFFAPANFAFEKLGPKINAFLFSKHGQKYLKALLLYHAAENFTLYSDAYYIDNAGIESGLNIPKSKFHVDLPTGLADKSLSIDVLRYGRLITMRVNGFTNVAILDGIAADGVIQVVSDVIIPPKTPGMLGMSSKELTVEELKARLEPFVEKDDFNLEL